MVLVPHFSKRLTNHLTEQTKTNMERSAAGVETLQSEIPMEKAERASPCEKSEEKGQRQKVKYVCLNMKENKAT